MPKHDYNASLPKLTDDWRYHYLSPLPDPQDDPNELSLNSELDQAVHDFSNPQRSPWLCVASLERTCPSELDNLTILTPKQREYIRLHHFEGLTLQETANRHNVSKPSVWRCLNRAYKQIDKNRDLVHEIMNASPCRAEGGNFHSYNKRQVVASPFLP